MTSRSTEMTTGNDLLDALLRLALAAGGVVLGELLLMRGHRLIWLFSGVAGFLLALFAVNLLNRWLGILDAEWLQAAIAVAAGVVGAIASRAHTTIAYGVIGLAMAGAILLWVARIVLTKQALVALDFWSVLGLILILFLL